MATNSTYLNNAMAHTVVVFTAYLAFGGRRLLRRRHDGALVVPTADGGGSTVSGEFERKHWLTVGVIGVLLAAVVLFNVDVGLGAFACAIALALFKAGDESEAVNLMPWRVIMMVCGVTVLISVLDATGGLALFTRILAGISTADTVTSRPASFQSTAARPEWSCRRFCPLCLTWPSKSGTSVLSQSPPR